MSEPETAMPQAEPEGPAAEAPQYLIGVRLRVPLGADDYLAAEDGLHVGDLVVVESGSGSAVGEVRRPRRPLPEFRRGRLYRRVLRAATPAEAAEWRDTRRREEEAVETCRRLARGRGLQMKVVDVEMEPARRRVTVYFSAE